VTSSRSKTLKELQREAREIFEKSGVLSFRRIPHYFGQGGWEQHCHECQYFGGHSPRGGHYCKSPHGTLGCFEEYRKKEGAGK